jgi:hypothetical protein
MGDEGKNVLVLRASPSLLITQGCLAHAINHARGPEGKQERNAYDRHSCFRQLKERTWSHWTRKLRGRGGGDLRFAGRKGFERVGCLR